MQFSSQNNADKPTNSAIGKPIDRTDGRLKVTGAARYAADFPMENLAHAVVVRSTIARGRIQSIDTSAAEKSPGVLAVITHVNAPKLATTDQAVFAVPFPEGAIDLDTSKNYEAFQAQVVP